MINSWKKKDLPPNRMKPIPIQVIGTIQFVASNSANLAFQHTTDMIILAFFFLLRPGEYTASPSDTQPFDLKSVQLFLGGRWFNLATSSDAQLCRATFASLTFDMQKNGVCGESIGLGLSGDPVLCPVLTLVRIVISLRRANASPLTPLSSVFIDGTWKPVTPNMVSTAIKKAVTLVGPSLGFLASNVSACCLRAAGANALVNARVDPEIITLISRWRSDELLCYLHVQNLTIMKNFAA